MPGDADTCRAKKSIILPRRGRIIFLALMLSVPQYIAVDAALILARKRIFADERSAHFAASTQAGDTTKCRAMLSTR